MTVVPTSKPEVAVSGNTGGRPRGSTGNGKSLKEIAAREERRLARLSAEQSIREAQAASADLNRISELRIAQRERKHTAYTQQEAKRAPQFQIDQRATLYLLGAFAAVMFITTAILSADGTIGAAASAHYAFPWFGYLLFGAVEVAVLVFMLTYYVLGSRVDHDGNPVKAGHWFFAMVIASFVAVGLSVFHVLDVYKFDWTSVEMWVGVGIRLATTVFFVIVSKAVATVLFAKAVRW